MTFSFLWGVVYLVGTMLIATGIFWKRCTVWNSMLFCHVRFCRKLVYWLCGLCIVGCRSMGLCHCSVSRRNRCMHCRDWSQIPQQSSADNACLVTQENWSVWGVIITWKQERTVKLQQQNYFVFSWMEERTYSFITHSGNMIAKPSTHSNCIFSDTSGRRVVFCLLNISKYLQPQVYNCETFS